MLKYCSEILIEHEKFLFAISFYDMHVIFLEETKKTDLSVTFFASAPLSCWKALMLGKK